MPTTRPALSPARVVTATTVALVCAGAVGASGASAAPTGARFTDPVTGARSTYEVVGDVLTWDDAEAAAAARTDPTTGCQGHLAVITSAQEQDFVRTRLDHPAGLWLGASKDDAGDFGWITGEPFAYTSWAPGQPDNSGGVEDKIQLAFYDSSSDWNDIAGSDTSDHTNGYLVEYQCSRPSITDIVGGDSGPTDGGTTVTIIGTDLTTAQQVTFGSTAATSFTVDSPTQITAVTPAYTGPLGRKGTVVPVRVKTSGGLSAKNKVARYRYLGPSSPK